VCSWISRLHSPCRVDVDRDEILAGIRDGFDGADKVIRYVRDTPTTDQGPRVDLEKLQIAAREWLKDQMPLRVRFVLQPLRCMETRSSLKLQASRCNIHAHPVTGTSSGVHTHAKHPLRSSTHRATNASLALSIRDR
jgi:hypothetical protein